MKFFLRIFLSILVVFWFLAVPKLSLAEDTSTGSSTATPAFEKDLRCWTEEACQTNGVFDKSTYEAKKACGGSSFGFCYPPAEKYSLSVALPIVGNVTTSVSDLGDYINKGYLFLLGISSIIAVLMLMVGGVRYVISGSGSEEITKAKSQINKSLSGLVLLFCATLILFTVNPQMIKLKMPSMPKMRAVFFVSDSVSCEDLHTAGYTTSPASGGGCDDEDGKVTSDPNGNAPSEEQTCPWEKCSDPDATCLSDATEGSTRHCLKCSDVASGNDYGVKPDSSTCSRLTPKDEPNKDYECFAVKDTAIDPDLSTSCALLTIECNLITKCEDYGAAKVKTESAVSWLVNIQDGLGSDLGLKTICEKDISICNIGAKTGGKCQFESNLVSLDVCKTVPL